jgi:hypothetical protein
MNANNNNANTNSKRNGHREHIGYYWCQYRTAFHHLHGVERGLTGFEHIGTYDGTNNEFYHLHEEPDATNCNSTCALDDNISPAILSEELLIASPEDNISPVILSEEELLIASPE